MEVPIKDCIKCCAKKVEWYCVVESLCCRNIVIKLYFEFNYLFTQQTFIKFSVVGEFVDGDDQDLSCKSARVDGILLDSACVVTLPKEMS